MQPSKPSVIGDIDVVIPTYNRLWALKRSIPFYLTQHEVRSIIVVNDASTDGTAAWLTQYCKNEPRVRCVNHEKNKGGSAARNTGAAFSQASLILFADDDVILKSRNALSILKKELLENSGDVISPVLCLSEHESSANVIFNAHSSNPRSLFSPFLEIKPWRRLTCELNGRTFVCCTLTGMMLMKKEVLNVVRYDNGLGRTGYRDETDFQFTAARKGFRLLACPKVSVILFNNPNDKGGCSHSLNVFAYELNLFRNNWRFLIRHKDDLKNFLGFSYPIEIAQALFIANRVCRIFPIRLANSLIKMRKRVK